ncbi:putative disease resistance protein [Gossypium australe]|uniref:Putative disease resistance protein n=1 Tax=Gossypium australe TaxID=47621 RepID=A0A5B6VS95_9ROSI|nr:putative disease resistance protein [Gossypium australe]
MFLLKDMDAKKSFPIGVLEHEEAWEFFKKIAGDGVESSDLLPIATEVAKKCGGLPIAISTLATSLRNEPPFVWKDALRQLSKPSSSNFKGVPGSVYSTIEWSYDRLQSEDHKQTFLLCSLLGHNLHLEFLLMCAMGIGLFHGVSTVEETRNRLLTVVSHLKASCLLLDGYNNLRLDMHDLISDVATSIAANHVFVLRREDVLNDWPDDETMKECDKISLLFPSMNKLPGQLKCPKLTLFNMDCVDPLMKIPANFFEKMKNLKALSLYGMNLPYLPSSISLLPNLRTLCLYRCVLGDIALIGELKNLEILSFDGSDIELLPEEIGQLTKLKWLDLTGCSKLKKIPPGVICKLSRLEELYVDDSTLFQLKALFPNLEKLKLSLTNIERIWFPQAFCSTQKLKKLIIKGYTNLKHVLSDSMVEYLQQLECLKISECKCIQEIISTENIIEEAFRNRYLICFPRLNTIKLKGLKKLIGFCHEDYTVKFPSLKTLEIESCPKLKGFIHNSKSKEIPTDAVFFNNKVLFSTQ